jgi:translation elongation factor EF-1beta
MDFGFDELSTALSYAVLMGGAAPAAAPSSSAKAAKAPAPAPAPKKAAAADDFDDMFGDDDDEGDYDAAGETAAEREAAKARRDRMEKARLLKEEADKKAGKVKKDKKKEAEKSLLVLEVKPWEADTDLEAVFKMIKEYQQEGLVWSESFKLEPVAFGIKKLVFTAVIVDSLVLMDDVTDNIEKLEDYVQSVTVASMTKV